LTRCHGGTRRKQHRDDQEVPIETSSSSALPLMSHSQARRLRAAAAASAGIVQLSGTHRARLCTIRWARGNRCEQVSIHGAGARSSPRRRNCHSLPGATSALLAVLGGCHLF